MILYLSLSHSPPQINVGSEIMMWWWLLILYFYYSECRERLIRVMRLIICTNKSLSVLQVHVDFVDMKKICLFW